MGVIFLGSAPGPRWGSAVRPRYRLAIALATGSVLRSLNRKPRIERVQALVDISRSVLCCHSNETRAPIANPPNSAQLDDPLPFPKLHLGPCNSVEYG